VFCFGNGPGGGAGRALVSAAIKEAETTEKARMVAADGDLHAGRYLAIHWPGVRIVRSISRQPPGNCRSGGLPLQATQTIAQLCSISDASM
jgi:hypothetical protein